MRALLYLVVTLVAAGCQVVAGSPVLGIAAFIGVSLYPIALWHTHRTVRPDRVG